MAMNEHKAKGTLHFVLEEKFVESAINEALAISAIKHLPDIGKEGRQLKKKAVTGS